MTPVQSLLDREIMDSGEHRPEEHHFDRYLPSENSPDDVIPIDLLHSTDRLAYHAESDTYRTEFDGELDAPADVVIHAIAAVADCSPFDLETLYSIIDPDALNVLLSSMTRNYHNGDGRISFTFHGYEVTVHSYGIVEIRSLDSPTPM